MEPSPAEICTDIDNAYRNVDSIMSVKMIEKADHRSLPDDKLLDIEPVGIKVHVEAVMKLFDMEGISLTRAVIIYGFGGAGKIALNMATVKELTLTGYKVSVVTMEKQNMYHLVTEDMKFTSDDHGRTELSEVLRIQLGFLFIDNVANKKDIQKLLLQNLYEGNKRPRIFITSQQSNVNREHNTSCVEESKIDSVSDESAKEILLKTIFQSLEISTYEIQNVEAQIDHAAAECGGISLLVRVYRKYLKHLKNNRKTEEYEKALEQGCYIEENLAKTLVYVYEEMDKDVKEVLQDICTFFHGGKWNSVSYLAGRIEAQRLDEAALVTMKTSEEVIVHHDLRATGINKEEGQQLRGHKDLELALKNEQKLKYIKGIWLDVNVSMFTLQENNVFMFTLQAEDVDAMEDSIRVSNVGGWIRVHGQCHATFTKLIFLQIGDLYNFSLQSDSFT